MAVFHILNVRAGGPYKVTVRLAGFREHARRTSWRRSGRAAGPQAAARHGAGDGDGHGRSQSRLFLSLSGHVGEHRLGGDRERCRRSRAASRTSRATPVLQRSAGQRPVRALSIAGRNGRYNNIQIDGAVNNDLFGLADSGTPGGQASTSRSASTPCRSCSWWWRPTTCGRAASPAAASTPSPAAAATSSGHRLLLLPQPGPGRRRRRRPPDRDLQRQAVRRQHRRPDRQEQGVFLHQRRWGRKNTPSGYSVDGSSGQAFGTQAEAQRFLDILQTRYGYDPGGIDEIIRDTPTTRSSSAATSTSASSQLTLRHNYIDALQRHRLADATSSTSSRTLLSLNSKTNSTVGQLNSTLRHVVQRVPRQLSARFATSATETELPARRGRSAGRRAVPRRHGALLGRQRAGPGHLRADRRLHWCAASTRSRSAPTTSSSSSGTSSSATSSAPTSSPASTLRAGTRPVLRPRFSATGDPLQPRGSASTSSGSTRATSGGAAERFTLTYGMRVDFPIFPDTPNANPHRRELFGYATDVSARARSLVAARRASTGTHGATATRSRYAAASASSPAARRTSGCRTTTPNTGIEFTPPRR